MERLSDIHNHGEDPADVSDDALLRRCYRPSVVKNLTAITILDKGAPAVIDTRTIVPPLKGRRHIS